MIKKISFRFIYFCFISAVLTVFLAPQCAMFRSEGVIIDEMPKTEPAYMDDESIKLGIDVLMEQKLDMVTGKRVGLITNQSGVNRNLISTIDILFSHPDVNLTTLFAPEHGIRGDIPAGQLVATYDDEKTGLPVYSLYGNTKKPTPEMLANVDVLLFDIQDVGVRPYTYIYTMAYAMEAAKENNVEFYVLDRPNPLGGNNVDGNLLHPDYKSFIGMYPIPYTHGMTVGELAWLFNLEFGIEADLRVIPVEGWQRDMPFESTNLQWIPTSPHIPTAETVAYYATTGSIGELGTISVGVGYTMPFKIVGAPWIEPEKLAGELNSRNLPGVTFRPMNWQQFYGIFNGQHAGGIEIHIYDMDEYMPFSTGIHILEAIIKLYPGQEIFKEDRISGFNRATGTDSIYKRLKEGVSAEVIIESFQEDIRSFKDMRLPYLLY
ncbi:exo-beta-N-acetylmuramidase NamZ domain-containing protein [candidate division KSB1 bacterium]